MNKDERAAWTESLNNQLARTAAEITRRSTTQQALQAANTTVVLAIAGVVISGKSTPILLVLIPVVSVMFGSQWLDHHRCIHRLGDFMAFHAERALTGALGDPPVERFQFWETYIRDRRGNERNAVWKLPVVAVFQGTAIAALALSVPSALVDPPHELRDGVTLPGVDVWARVVWVAALLLTVASCRSVWTSLGKGGVRVVEREMSFGEFEAAFAASARVALDWRRLRDQEPIVGVEVVTDRSLLRRWHTTWYVADGREVDYTSGTTPLTFGEVAEQFGALDPERRAAIDSIAAELRDGYGAPVFVAAYALPEGGRLVLDGNHRIAAATRYDLPVTVVAAVVHAPAKASVLPDLAAWGG